MNILEYLIYNIKTGFAMIKVKDLQFKYQGSDRFALDGVNVEIPRGKYVAILGHNGSGKSTFSKLISGLYKPTFGEIYIDGIMIKKSSLREIRKKIGIIFQNPDNQFIGSTVEDDLAFGLENARVPKEQMNQTILELIKKVDMQDYLKREPSSLSGGQKQRVAIASVLALNPEIIIFDEVTSMLDPKGKQEVLEIIRQIQHSREKTLISITHDMDEAIMADYCIIFSGGKILASGNPKDLLNDKNILELSKIDSPFIYKISSKINGMSPTYDINELLEKI